MDNLNDNDIKKILLNKIHSYRETQLIFVAAKLKISDILIKSGKTIDELAKLTKTHKESLYRVLRACTSIGLYIEKDGKFYLTKLGNLLISNNPDSIRSVAIMRGEEVNWKPWGELLYAVKTGESAFKKVFNMDLFEYYNKNPKSGEVFNDGMRITTKDDIEMILEKYDFSNFERIIDIGGGNGALLISILEKYKNCIGILYDLPNVIKESKKYIDISMAKDNIKMESGNMFLNIPKGGDCYLLKRILHDWDDYNCIKILKNCRESIVTDGRLLIIDSIITKNKPTGKINDVHMMIVCPGGKERTRKEFIYLLNQSGFELKKIIGNDGISIIECTPV